MRVGLVTWWSSKNCGTCLQAYALFRAVEGLGCDASMMDLVVPHFGIKYWVRLVLSAVGLCQLRIWLRNFIRRRIHREAPPTKLEAWVKSTFRVKHIKHPWSMHLLVAKTDCFVSGSDQIWNTYYERFSPRMFLDCVGNARRVAYASSIGTKGINPVYAERVKGWLSKFARIGVRESSAVKALKELTGRDDIVQVMDPVFLLSAEEWRDFGRIEPDVTKEKYLLCYMLGDNPMYAEKVLSVGRKLGINRVIVMPSCERPDFRIEGCETFENPIPPEFVALVARASAVCTDSFHASALSLILGRELVVFRRFASDEGISQNSRIYDLLNMFGLDYRLYDGDDGHWQKPIDWRHVGEVVDRERDRSLRFLREGLELEDS